MTQMMQRTEKRMSDAYLKNVVEAALLAAARPVSVAELLQIFDESARPTNKEMRAILETLAADYDGRGVQIRETATGFRFQVLEPTVACRQHFLGCFHENDIDGFRSRRP